MPNHVKADAFIILPEKMARLQDNLDLIAVLAKASSLVPVKAEAEIPAGCGTGIVEGCQIFLAIKNFIDPKKEVDRLTKKIAQQDALIANMHKKTSIKDYATKVPEKVQKENA